MSDPPEAAKPARRPMYEHGAETDRDPDHLERRTTPAEIHEWVATLTACRDVRRAIVAKGIRGVTRTPTTPVFSEWEREKFLPSITTQVERHTAEGRARLLTGRQLVVLKDMLNRLAAATATMLEGDKAHG